MVANPELEVDVTINKQSHTLYFVHDGVALHQVLVIGFAILLAFQLALDDQRHADVVMHQATLRCRYEMNFAYQAIDSSAHVAFDFKNRLEEGQIHQLMRPLEVSAIVPLYHRVLELANSIGVAEDFKHAVSDLSLLAVVAVGQHVVLTRLTESWGEPLN